MIKHTTFVYLNYFVLKIVLWKILKNMREKYVLAVHLAKRHKTFLRLVNKWGRSKNTVLRTLRQALSSALRNAVLKFEGCKDPSYTQPTFTCSKSPMETPEHWRWGCRSDIFIVNFEKISHIVQVFPLLTLNN